MRKLALALAAALGLTVSAGPVAAQDKVIFSLNWIPGGNHYGVFAAKEQGYFREANLEVEIQRGYGSGDTVKRIGTGAAHIGIGDAVSVIVGRNTGQKVKQVAILFERAADAIFFVEGNRISKPKDLEGRTLGATPGETTLNLLPTFAANTGIDLKKIEIVPMTPPVKYASLAAKTVDSMVGFVNEEPTIRSVAEKAGLKVGRFKFTDHGVDYYSIGLIVSDDTLANRPDLVRRLVSATMKGYAWALKNQEGAADAFAKNLPEGNRALTLQQWGVAAELILTDSTRKSGLGWIELEKMERTLDLVKKFHQVDAAITARDLYTMEYLPKILAE